MASATSAAPVVPSEVQTSGGAAEPPTVAEVSRVPFDLSDMHVTTPEEVREVLHITREATAEDRSTLVDAALHAVDPLVVGNAVLALGRLKAFSSDAALLELVSDLRLRVRQDAVRACGLDGRDAALPQLQRALELGDASVRPLVLEALGRIGGTKARALLETVADDRTASKTDRVFARAALRANT